MSLFRIPVLSILVLFFLYDGVHAADVGNTKVTSSVSVSEIKIGERVELSIIVEHDRGTDAFFPDESARVAPFEIIGHKINSKKSYRSRQVTEITYILTSFETGDLMTPPLLITAKDGFGEEKNILTQRHKISVRISEGVGKEILDILPPLEIVQGRSFMKEVFSFVLYISALIMSSVMLVVYLYLSNKKRPVMLKDPRVLALDSLASISVNERDISQVYFRISCILRSFFGTRLNADFENMTSTELLRSVTDKLGIVTDVRDLFFDVDLVKFSQFSPSVADAKEAVKRADKIIRGTP